MTRRTYLERLFHNCELSSSIIVDLPLKNSFVMSPPKKLVCLMEQPGGPLPVVLILRQKHMGEERYPGPKPCKVLKILVTFSFPSVELKSLVTFPFPSSELTEWMLSKKYSKPTPLLSYETSARNSRVLITCWFWGG